jgi:predicted NBD/HSP70 family sugar kinase
MELLDKATKGDEICTKAIERMMNYLAVAIINMESAYDTECFVIGGDLHFCQDIAIHHIQEKLQKRAFSWGKIREVKVEPSSFMGSASFIGTVALVMENNLES